MKFAEKKLLTYDYQPEEHTRARKLPGKPKRVPVLRRGPIILAVDTSASMQGESEENAKALALSLTRIAFRQHRSVHLIMDEHSFSRAGYKVIRNGLSDAKDGHYFMLGMANQSEI